MALKKPTDLFGLHKVTKIVEEIDRFETLEETHELTGGSPGGNFSVSFSASMIDEIFKNLQARIEKTHKADIQGVYEELAKCKKLVNTTQLKVEGRVGALKKELYERIDEHIATAQQTIQELYQTEIRQIKKLSNDIELVERYIATHSKDIVRLRSQINEELQKRPIAIDRIETKIDLVAESYQHLSENLNEGLLNEPVTADPLDNTDFVTVDQLKDHYRLFLNRIEEQLSTLGGGGETQFKYLDDIVGVATNASAYDGKFLRYNHGLGKFEFISNGPWVDTFDHTGAYIGIHTLTSVGIGTTNISGHPNAKLNVDGSVRIFGDYGNIEFIDYSPNRDAVTGIRWHEGDRSPFPGFNDASGWNDSTRMAIDYNGDVLVPGSGMLEIKGFSLSTLSLDSYAVITREGRAGIGSTRPRSSLDVAGDVSVGYGTTYGVILTSPNGTRYRISVDNSGNLSTTAV